MVFIVFYGNRIVDQCGIFQRCRVEIRPISPDAAEQQCHDQDGGKNTALVPFVVLF